LSAEQSEQVTRFPLVRTDSTIIEAIVAVLRRLSKAHSLHEIGELVTHAARTLLAADGVTFVLKDGDHCYCADEDAISPLWKGKRFPMRACVSGWCMTERQAVVIRDIYEDARVPLDAYRATSVRSLAIVPVREDDPVAAIGAYWCQTKDISLAELELLQTIANSTALAIAKVELEQKQARAHELIEQASDGIFIADLDGRYVDVNEAGSRLLGYSREEILGMTIMDLILPEEKERLFRHRELFLKGGYDVGEWLLRRKDGTYLPVEVSAKILADGRWQGIARDISERRRAEDALRMAQERLDLALKGADLATWDWNVKTDAVVFNSRWAEMRGFRPEEVRPHVDSCHSGIHPDDRPAVLKVMGECLEGLRPEFACEYRVATKSGQWMWILDSGKVFERDKDGRPTRMAGTEFDISARKHAEQTLRLSEAAAKRATQAREDMLGIVAHDLRNPLAAILALATVLQKGPERDIGDEIAVAARRMNRLIHDLIDLTLLEAGTFAIKQERLHTGDFLARIVASQAPLASSASLTLRLDAAPGISDISADHDRLLQVFENLIGNAIKFTEAGGQIILGAKAGDGEVVFSVADTGCGIESGHLPHVFDRFWQAPEAKRHGAGLGLPIVKGIVEAHGGRIWVQSNPGQGSTFFFTIRS
jgi:PAS domain S-box-containing protein